MRRFTATFDHDGKGFSTGRLTQLITHEGGQNIAVSEGDVPKEKKETATKASSSKR